MYVFSVYLNFPRISSTIKSASHGTQKDAHTTKYTGTNYRKGKEGPQLPPANARSQLQIVKKLKTAETLTYVPVEKKRKVLKVADQDRKFTKVILQRCLCKILN